MYWVHLDHNSLLYKQSIYTFATPFDPATAGHVVTVVYVIDLRLLYIMWYIFEILALTKTKVIILS